MCKLPYLSSSSTHNIIIEGMHYFLLFFHLYFLNMRLIAISRSSFKKKNVLLVTVNIQRWLCNFFSIINLKRWRCYYRYILFFQTMFLLKKITYGSIQFVTILSHAMSYDTSHAMSFYTTQP